MNKHKVLSSSGAVSSFPQGNAIVTMDGNGVVTMVQGAVIPPQAVVKSSVSPSPDTQWLRVAVCNATPFFAIMAICGTYVAGLGDGSPVFISFGGGGTKNANYIKDRISTLANGKAGTLSKVRAVADGGLLYIDLLFHTGGGVPTVGLIGAHGVELLEPSIAPDVETGGDLNKVFVYELS